MKSWAELTCIGACILVAPLPAQSQEFPTRPVTFITPAAAGNSPLGARLESGGLE